MRAKVKFIEKCESFAKEYKYNEELLELLKCTDDHLFELQERFFHTAEPESDLIEHCRIVLSVTYNTIKRMNDNGTTIKN